MPAEIILELDGVTERDYDAVNSELGIDFKTGQGNWPDGLIAHSAGVSDSGRFVVSEIWDTPEHQAAFMQGPLAEALAKSGVQVPASVTWIELVAHHHAGK